MNEKRKIPAGCCCIYIRIQDDVVVSCINNKVNNNASPELLSWSYIVIMLITRYPFGFGGFEACARVNARAKKESDAFSVKKKEKGAG